MDYGDESMSILVNYYDVYLIFFVFIAFFSFVPPLIFWLIHSFKTIFRKFQPKPSIFPREISAQSAPVIENLPSIEINLAEFVKMALEVWRIENRVSKVASLLPDTHNRGFANSLHKVKAFLELNQIQIVDYTNQKYNIGLNVDVIAFDNDPNATEETVKETLEPSIFVNGQLAKQAKIIVQQRGK